MIKHKKKYLVFICGICCIIVLINLFNDKITSIENPVFYEKVIFDNYKTVRIPTVRSSDIVYEINSIDGRIFIIDQQGSPFMDDEFENEVFYGDELEIKFEKRYPWSGNKYIVHELKKEFKYYYYNDDIRTVGEDILFILNLILICSEIIVIIVLIIGMDRRR